MSEHWSKINYNQNTMNYIKFYDMIFKNYAQYGNRNESSCDNAINDYLGFNWKTTNFSKAPVWKNDKWDSLVNKCQ